MEALLDSSKELDLNLLDKIADVFYGGKGSADEVSLILYIVGIRPALSLTIVSNQRKNAEQVLKKV